MIQKIEEVQQQLLKIINTSTSFSAYLDWVEE